MPRVRVKRVYDHPEPEDGTRVLIDRLWPRGLSKERAAVDLWLKELGPSEELRRWFGHDPTRFEDFKRRYQAELEAKEELLAQLEGLAKQEQVTILYGARDTRHNNAVVVAQFLDRRWQRA